MVQRFGPGRHAAAAEPCPAAAGGAAAADGAVTGLDEADGHRLGMDGQGDLQIRYRLEIWMWCCDKMNVFFWMLSLALSTVFVAMDA